jgi:hypothetical protein
MFSGFGVGDFSVDRSLLVLGRDLPVNEKGRLSPEMQLT